MGLANNQEIPNKPREEQPWTMRSLFPFASATSAISKTFTNSFDVLLAFIIVIIGFVELFGDASWQLYVLAVLLLAANVFERYMNRVTPPVVEEKK